MKISFTNKQKKYINYLLDTGEFKNASEVIRDALSLHQNFRLRLIEDLKKEIAMGWSGATGIRTPTQIAQDKLDRLNN